MMTGLAKKLGMDITAENFQIRAEQMRTLLQAYPAMIAANSAMAPLVAWLMWNKIEYVWLLAWLAALYAFHALEIYRWRTYPQAIRSIEECRRWQRQFLLSDVLVGALWGSAGVFMFVPDEPLYQAILLCIMVGMSCASVAGNLVFPLSQQSYVALVTLPILFNILSEGGREYYLLAAMVGVFLLFVMKTGRDQSKFFELSIRRGFENIELAGQLEIKRAEAEQANKMKSRFLAAASHDLRQPMQALTLYVEVLKGHTADAEGDELLGRVERSVELLGAMFDALLDVSKLDAGVVQPNIQPFALQPLLDRMYGEFNVLAQDKGLELKVAIGCGAVVESDPLLLERILRNLISNALRYTVQGEVTVTCVQLADEVRLEVRDTGIGIAPTHLPHIFEEYYQVGDRKRDRNKGLGLGLAIVKRLELLLGYQMQVKSTMGAGTSFALLIPLSGPNGMIEKNKASQE